MSTIGARAIVHGYMHWKCRRCGCEINAGDLPMAAMDCPDCESTRGKSVAMVPKKPGRYGIKKSPSLFPGGRSYDSPLEHRFADELQLRARASNPAVRNIVEKEPVPLIAGINWRIDFACEERDAQRDAHGAWRLVRYETKGPEDREYALKLKLYRTFGDAPLYIVKESGKRRHVQLVIPDPRAAEYRALIENATDFAEPTHA